MFATDRHYQDKQRRQYQEALSRGHTAAAHDALWRAASAANRLDSWEAYGPNFSPERVAQLVRELGW